MILLARGQRLKPRSNEKNTCYFNLLCLFPLVTVTTIPNL